MSFRWCCRRTRWYVPKLKIEIAENDTAMAASSSLMRRLAAIVFDCKEVYQLVPQTELHTQLDQTSVRFGFLAVLGLELVEIIGYTDP